MKNLGKYLIFIFKHFFKNFVYILFVIFVKNVTLYIYNTKLYFITCVYVVKSLN